MPQIETVPERAIRLGLEESAISDVWCEGPHISGASESEVETSKAISLKRIADTLAVRKGEADYAAVCASEAPDGTIEGLERAASMLERWGPETFPASEEGKVHFGRAMTDSVAAEIRAFLANFGTVMTNHD